MGYTIFGINIPPDILSVSNSVIVRIPDFTATSSHLYFLVGSSQFRSMII